MIKVSFKKQNGSFSYVEVSGHSGFSHEGEDIVCSAVSSVLWCITNSLTNVLNIPLDITENDGYVSYNIPQLDPGKKEKADLLIESMRLFFKELQLQYCDFIQVMEV